MRIEHQNDIFRRQQLFQSKNHSMFDQKYQLLILGMKFPEILNASSVPTEVEGIFSSIFF